MKFKYLIFIFIIFSLFFSCYTKNNKTVRIAIFQFIQHPALDEIKNNIIKNLYNTYPEIIIKEYNSQGDIETGITIINRINNEKFDAVIAIATPSAKLASQHIKSIPIIFTAVTDPVSAGLVESFDKPGKNITGVSDYIGSKNQIEFIKQFNPEIKNLGIIYNTSEENSKVFISDLQKESGNINIKLSEITTSGEVKEAALGLINNIDAMFMIFDNTVASAFSDLLNVCREYNKPLYVTDKTYVHLGADAGLSIDYSYLSLLTAKIVEKIINGKSPAEIPVNIIDKFEIYSREKLLEKKRLKLFTLQYPPYQFLDNNEIKGVAYDIVAELFNRAGYTISIEVHPWTKTLDMVKNGEADAVFTIYHTEEREKFLDYTSEILIIQQTAFFKLKDNDIIFDGDFNNLKGLSVATVKGVNYGTEFEKAAELNIFKIYDNAIDGQDSIENLVSRKTDLMVSNVRGARYLAVKLNQSDKIEMLTPVLENIPSYLAFSKYNDYTEIKNIYESELKKMKQDGTYNNILKKYFMFE